MKLYIANATRQVVDFLYRVPGNQKLMSQTIRVGSQIALSGDLSTDDIDVITTHHRTYGMVGVSEIDSTRRFIPLVFSVDRAVSAAVLNRLMDRNTGSLVESGKAYRRDMAIANNQVLESQLAEGDRPERLAEFEMTVIEENHDDRDGSEAIAEGVIVSASAPHSDGRPARARSSKRGR